MTTLPESAPMGQHAAALAREGLYVFPIQYQSKIPFADTRGFLDASSSVKYVEEQFAKYADKANIGLATGQSGLVVIDVDSRHDGLESWDALQRGFKKFETVEVETGGGGRHVYFRANRDYQITSNSQSFGSDFPGVDIRAAGGYVVAPPSLHESGRRYVFDAGVDDIAPIPSDILEDLWHKQAELRSAPKAALVGKVAEGSRNKELTRVAGGLRRIGLHASHIFAALVQINKESCVPPLPERELLQIANSIARKAPEEELFAASSSLRMVIKAAADLRSVRQEWLAEGRIPRGELTIFEGRGGLGKSTCALDIVSRLSSRRPLLGSPALDNPVKSLLIAEEDGASLTRARLKAAGADLNMVFVLEGLRASEDDDLVPFRLPRDLQMLRSVIKEHGFQVCYVDALFNSFESKYSVNSAQDVRTVLGGLSKAAQETGCTIIVTRHVGKADRVAKDRGLGSVELLNLARSVIQFDEESEGSEYRVLKLVKSNYSKPLDDLIYTFEEVSAFDDNGEAHLVAKIKWPTLAEPDTIIKAHEPTGLLDYARTALA